MRIAAKLTLAIILAMTLALGLQATLNIQRVEELHQRETRDDLEILGRVLGSAASQLWQASGEAVARDYLVAADERRARTRIELKEGAAQVLEASRQGDGLVLHVPLAGMTPEHHLELRRSMDRALTFREGMRRDQLLTTLALILAVALLAMALGLGLIGRPVESLIAQTRRVAEGDLASRTQLHSRDELGRLARELDRMTERLADAQSQVSEQRQARAALNEQLRHADRLSTVGRVASGIAHELGTPLNVVSGRAAMIEMETEPAEMIEHARIIGRQSKRMTEIIRDLLDFSRQRRSERREARLKAVLDEATTLIEPIADKKSVGIEVELHDRELALPLDVNRTLQVLTNLMMNAVQAMPDGGPLVLRTETQAVEAPGNDHSEPGDYVAIRVIDRGTGIPEAERERIFQPFFTTKDVGRGTGLGLYVCQGIVREQGGWIEVDSEPGEGSTFTVWLPLQPEAA